MAEAHELQFALTEIDLDAIGISEMEIGMLGSPLVPTTEGGTGTGKDGREVELRRNESGTLIQWRYTGDAQWRNLVSVAELAGPAGDNGKSAQFRNNGTNIQWRLVGDADWINLVALDDITGPSGSDGTDGTDGREVALRLSSGMIQWQYVGSLTWTDLVSVASLSGPPGPEGADGNDGTDGTDGTDGREVQLRNNSTHIQWRYAGDASWINLVALSEITGPPGSGGGGSTLPSLTGNASKVLAVKTDETGTEWITAPSGSGGGSGGVSTSINTLRVELAKKLAQTAVIDAASLDNGEALNYIVDQGGLVGIHLSANTNGDFAGRAIGTSFTVPAGCKAIVIGGSSDDAIFDTPAHYRHRLYNVTQSAVIASFGAPTDSNAQGVPNGYRISKSGIFASGSGTFGSNPSSYPVAGVAGDVIRAEAWTSGDGAFRVQIGEYYVAIVDALTGELKPLIGTSGGSLAAPAVYGELAYDPPSASSFVIRKVGTPTVSISDIANKGMALDLVKDGGNRAMMAATPVPTAPYFVSARVVAQNNVTGQEYLGGIALRNNTSGRCVVFYFYSDGIVYAQNWHDVNGYASSIAIGPNFVVTKAALYFGIHVAADGTITFYSSGDGDKWDPVGTSTVGAWLGTIDEAGPFLASSTGVTQRVRLLVPYWFLGAASGPVPAVSMPVATGTSGEAVAAGNLECIGSFVADGTMTNFDFTSISAEYEFLELVIQGRLTDSDWDGAVRLQFNGDTGGNYEYYQNFMQSGGVTGIATSAQSSFIAGQLAAANADAGYAGHIRATIAGYNMPSRFTSIFSNTSNTANATRSRALITSGWWNNVAIVNSLRVSGNFAAGATLLLYGYRKLSGTGSSGIDFSPPVASTFSVLSSGDATNLTLSDDADRGMIIRTPVSGSGYLRAALKPLTNKNLDWTLTTKIIAGPFMSAYLNLGVLLRDSISGRPMRFSMTNDQGIYVVNDNNMVSFDSVPASLGGGISATISMIWLRVVKTSAALSFQFSIDGLEWEELYSSAPNSWMTNLPDQVGFYIASLRSRGNPTMIVPYWSLTGPGA